METIKCMRAVKEFLEKDAAPIPLAEFRDFWTKLTDVEKENYGVNAARMLGKTLEAGEPGAPKIATT